MSQPPGRLIIVVPRHDPKLFAYLQRSFSQAPNIDVVLDRRLAPPASAPVTTPDLRRRAGTRSILGGLTIASAASQPVAEAAPATPAPAPVVQEPRPAAPAPARPRLWPTLQPRDFTLVIPDADANGEPR